ncbi:MAG: DNA gyrase subunit B [Armatimonadetes bacterium]|nr:DNA gyrase subunit B [Armatimonadota bacterium]
MARKQTYDTQSIVVMEPMEAVRLRPGMYVGDDGERGMNHLIWEVVDNAVDEAMQGHCTVIALELANDGLTVTVEDNGRGIPVDPHPSDGRSTLEVVMTVLHAGGKFGRDEAYTETGGLHGVGVSCVNALSEHFQVNVWRMDKSAGATGEFSQTFAAGKPLDKVKRVGQANKTGTKITFRPDSSIFKTVRAYDPATIVRRLREVAHLNPGLTVMFYDGVNDKDYTFVSEGGIADMLRDFVGTASDVYPETPLVIEGKSNGVTVKLGMQYREVDEESLHSYANNIHTPDGGTHLTGFKRALTVAVNSAAKQAGLVKDSLQSDDIRDGLVTVLTVKLRQPQFEGQTKGRLGSPEADSGVSSVVAEKLGEYFQRDPQFLKRIVDRALLAQKAREAAKQQSEIIKRKGAFSKTTRLPGKLKDCNVDDRSDSELFIVEGDSAAGSAIDGRDPQTQAVLPLRGKIMNAEKNALSEMLKNEEVRSLVTAIGSGVEIPGKESFRLKDRRYERIIVMTDADVDGGHIETLLLAFFYRYMRPLVVEGCLYLAVPPLYKVEDGKGNKQYCWDEQSLRKATDKSKSARVTRFKGLGEMNPAELAETTMNRDTRKLVRVSVPDIDEANAILTTFMGKSVTARKGYLLERSHQEVLLG